MRNRDELERRVRAVLAAGVTGAAVLAMMQYLVFPRLTRGLTAAEVRWLREAFQTHPGWVLLATVALAAVSGLPVLLAGLWGARLGPWRDKRTVR